MAVLENSELLIAIAVTYLMIVWVVLRQIFRYRRFFGIRFKPRTIAVAVLYGLFSGGGFAIILGMSTGLGYDESFFWASDRIFPTGNTLFLAGAFTALSLAHTAASAGLIWFFLNSETEDRHILTRITPLVMLATYLLWANLFTDASIQGILTLSILPLSAFAFGYSVHFDKITLTTRPLFRVLILISLLISVAIFPLIAEKMAPDSLPSSTISLSLYIWCRYLLFAIFLIGVLMAIFIATTKELHHLRTYRSFRNRMEDIYLTGGFIVLVVFVEIATRYIIQAEISGIDPFLAEINSKRTLFLMIFIYVLYSFVVIYLTHQFNRPIHAFREALNKTATGDMNALMQVNRKDDVGELADTYNMMVFRLKNLQDELAETERQAAWSEMARQVAHEIKNPLTPMKLSIQHLYQQVEYHQRPIEDVRQLVKRISNTLIEEIDSLSNIATDFSKFAKPVTEEFRRIDFSALVLNILELYTHDERIDFHVDCPENELHIHAAQDELKRVLINLIKNAMEASGPGGLIFIRAYRHQTYVVVEVADNGKGMDEQVRKKVFVPNFSTKNSGTGLGLAISRKIVQAHKGSIQFASVVGLGTTFTVYLPLADSVEASSIS